MKLLLTATALTLTMCSAPTYAQNLLRVACSSQEMVEERLSVVYEEEVITEGVTSSGVLMQVWLNEFTGTWTVTSVDGNEAMCVIMTGEGGLEQFDFIGGEAL